MRLSQPRKDDGRLLSASACARWEDTTIKKRAARRDLVCCHCSFSFSSLNQNRNLFHFNMSPSPISVNDASPSVSPTFLNDASPSDEEEEQILFTQPEAEAEAIDLTVESDPPKRKATTQGKTPNTEKSDPPKRKATNPGKQISNKKKQRCDISDADLESQLRQVSPQNANDSLLRANDSLLHAATEDNETKRVTKKYFTIPALGNKSSVWWEGFAQLMPSKHPKLFTEYVVCLSCLKSSKNPDLGLVKIGISQSTSNLRAHKKFNHPKEYEVIANKNNLKTPQSVPTTSIKNMPGFVAKLNITCSKLIYRTAAATLAIEEGIPFRSFEQPAFRRLFTPLHHESDKIVKLTRHQVKDAVLEMGSYAVEATKREIHNHQIAWTTDHWTGQDKATYTTVTAHWIDGKTWMLKSAVLDFKIFEGSTTGERIYEDVMAVLQKYQGETEDTIVFDTIGITDTTGNMGKLGKYLRDNGKEHGYCTDHNLHLVAKLAFEREST